MLFQLGIDRLGQPGLLKTNYLRAFDSESFFEILRSEMLNDWVVRKVKKNFRAAVFRDVSGDDKEMKTAFAAVQGVAAYDQSARAQHKWEQTLDRSGGLDRLRRSYRLTGTGGRSRSSRRVGAIAVHDPKRL